MMGDVDDDIDRDEALMAWLEEADASEIYLHPRVWPLLLDIFGDKAVAELQAREREAKAEDLAQAREWMIRDGWQW